MKTQGNAVIVSLGGEIDAASAPELNTKLTQTVNSGQTRVVINMEKLEYINSAGIRALLATAKLINAKSGKLVLVGLHGTVKQVLEISGLYSVFAIAATDAEALKQLA